MAESINNNELNQEEQSQFTFARIWQIIILNWMWIALSTFLALGIAFGYLRYTRRVYQSSMKILIKDDESKSKYVRAGQMNLENMGIFSNSNGFDNEMEILQSTNIANRVIKSLKLYATYFEEGYIRNGELYKNNPIIVDMPQDDHDALRGPIMMEISRKGEGFKVDGEIYLPTPGAKTEILEFSHDIKVFPSSFRTPVGTVILQRNPGHEISNKKLYANIYPMEMVTRSYVARLSAESTSKVTTVAQISFLDTKVERSLDYLSELIKSYNDDANEDKNQVALKTEEFIKERIEIIREELESTEGELESFKKTNDLIDLSNIATNALNQTTTFKNKQVELETQINLINALVDYMNNPLNTLQVIPANLGLEDKYINDEISKYNEMALQRNRLLKTSSEDNPVVERMTSTLEDSWKSIRMSLMAIKDDVQTQRRSAQQQADLFNSRISSSPTQERVLTSIGRQQELKSTLYLLLLQKREENFISLASTVDKARIIDAPRYDGRVSPRSKVILLLALVLGFGFPIAIVMLIDLLRYRIGGREDVEKLTSLPILADIPQHAGSTDYEKKLAVRENTNDMMEEAFRGLRTNLRFILNSDENVIISTSCVPGEGKTFVATNLAMSLALMGKKVVVVGLDIRKPRLVKLFGIPASQNGITTVISSDHVDFDLIDSQITHGVVNANLDILPAGVIPPNPGELISREQLATTIEILSKHYDYVLLDTPPFGLVSDTLSIARLAHATIVVCRADYSLRSNFDFINQLNREGKLPKMSVVLNGIDLKKRKYGYYYGGKYGYGKTGRYGHYGLYGNYASKHHGFEEK